MFTDPNHLRVEDPGQVEGNPVFIYLDAFCKPEHFEEFLPSTRIWMNLKHITAGADLAMLKLRSSLTM